MKILVTGGAGFIGSQVADRYLESGHEVFIVDDLSMGKERNVNPRARFYRMDIRDRALREVFEKERPEVINHHAAQVDLRRSVREPSWDAGINILGSLHLLELAQAFGVHRFIYISTGGAVYGEPKYHPVDELHPVLPLSPYGISKHTAERYMNLYGESHGLPYTILRYPNVYGPRQDPKGEAGVVAIFSQQMLSGRRPTIFGDGSKTRDYVYVQDIAEANVLALTAETGEVFNLGWGREVRDLEIFEAIRGAVGIEIEPIYSEKRPGEVDRICLDSSKARRLLGWEPKVPLEEGIRRAVAFYRLALQAEL